MLAGLFLAAVMAIMSLGMPGTAAAATMPAGNYELKVRHSNKCLDVAHGIRVHAADVIQGTRVGGKNQQWKFVRTEGDFYKVVARHSQRCLDVAHMSIAHAADVIQGDCWTPGFNQPWQLVKKK